VKITGLWMFLRDGRKAGKLKSSICRRSMFRLIGFIKISWIVDVEFQSIIMIKIIQISIKIKEKSINF